MFSFGRNDDWECAGDFKIAKPRFRHFDRTILAAFYFIPYIYSFGKSGGRFLLRLYLLLFLVKNNHTHAYYARNRIRRNIRPYSSLPFFNLQKFF